MGGGKALVNAYYRSAEKHWRARSATTRRSEPSSSMRPFRRGTAGETRSTRALACSPPVGSNRTASGCGRPGDTTIAANGRQTISSSGVRVSTRASFQVMMTQAPIRSAIPSQAHCVAIDARAPLYDGGICTRVDGVSLGVMLNRDAKRFYDEGEDFWPKRYAIWGRLVAQQPGQIGYWIIDSKAIGRFMPPVFPGTTANTLPELARNSGWIQRVFMQTLDEYNNACRSERSTTRCSTTARRSGLTRPRPIGRYRSIRLLSTAMPCALASHSPISALKIDDTAAVHFADQPSRQSVRRRRDDGRQRARKGLYRRGGNEHRHGIRPHRWTSCGGRARKNQYGEL